MKMLNPNESAHLKLGIKYTISISTVIWIILLRVVLDIGYIFFVSDIYAYDGFSLVINYYKVLESYLLLLLVTIFIPSNANKPSVILLYLLLILVIIPLLSMYGLADKDRWMLYLVLSGYVLIIGMTVIQLRIKTGMVTIQGMHTFAMLFIVLITALFFIHVSLNGAWNYFNLDITRVYEFRNEASLSVYSGFWGYLTNWLVKVLNLTLIGWYLYKKKYFLLALVLAIQVIYFGLTGHKSTLFVIFLVLGLYVLFQKERPIKLIILSVVLVILLSLLIAIYVDNVWVASLFIRRAFYVPANLTWVYLDFFSINPHVYMSNSIFSAFYTYPYDIPTSSVIGAYLGHPDMAANNGFFASGYMHFGISGVIVFSFIVGLLLWILDIISTRLPVWLCLSVVIGPFVSLFTSSDLGTTLLTHGLLLALMMLYFLSSREKKLCYHRVRK